MSKERRKHNHPQHKHGAKLPDKHPGAVAQKKKKRNVIGTILLIAGIAGVAYVTITGS